MDAKTTSLNEQQKEKRKDMETNIVTESAAHQATPETKPRRVLVTGGNRGIGAAIASEFARAGYSVAITYRSGLAEADETLRRIGLVSPQAAAAIQLDMDDKGAISRAVDEAADALGGTIDVLVNNAGYADMSGPEFTSISDETLGRTIQTNIVGPFVLTQSVVPRMPRGGVVVNIGSCLSSRVPTKGFTSYATSKAAVTGFTKGLARDLGERGIRVVEIAPGSVNTDMNPDDGPSAEFQRSSTVLGRYADPTEIARVALFVASDAASYITGASVAVDGGTNV